MTHIDLPSELIVKMLLGVLLGGMIGTERELLSKSAGFRTMILICLGATIYTICSHMFGSEQDATRIASNVVVGIGFVGGGVIFKGDAGVSGITTAATIWVTAAIGMMIGGGYYQLAIIAAVIVVIVLFLFVYIERFLDRINRVRTYKMVYEGSLFREAELKQEINRYRLTLQGEHYKKEGELLTIIWQIQGREKYHHEFVRQMLKDEQLNHFEY